LHRCRSSDRSPDDRRPFGFEFDQRPIIGQPLNAILVICITEVVAALVQYDCVGEIDGNVP
jgi:hypothetical protein